MRLAIFPFLIACGGGPSVSGEPAVSIVSAGCTALGTTVFADITYAATLDVGNSMFGQFQFINSPNEIPASVDEDYLCGFWNPLEVEDGCHRDTPDDAASEAIDHRIDLAFAQPVTEPASVMLIVTAVEAPGSAVVLDQDSQSVSCN